MKIDVHQHIWTEPLLNALAARSTLPFVRRDHGLVTLFASGEQPYLIDVQANEPQRRVAQLAIDGVDRAVISISSPIGIETLPRRQALPLIDAYLEGAHELPSEFAAWAPIALDELDPEDVEHALSRGAVGISLPAGALEGPDSFARIVELLSALEDVDAPLFIHPGPAPWTLPREVSLSDPIWWPALTGYVAQMQAAWLTFATLARPAYPRLRVVFTLLAGGAPLLAERLRARGGPRVDLRDPYTFYETSSHGPQAVGALTRLVGAAQILYGSDAPMALPSVARGANAERGAALLERVAA